MISKADARNRAPSREFLYRLANNVKRLRKAQGLTQQELARRCGFGTGYIGDIERAVINITAANLEALATGLACYEEDLVRRSGQRTSSAAVPL